MGRVIEKGDLILTEPLHCGLAAMTCCTVLLKFNFWTPPLIPGDRNLSEHLPELVPGTRLSSFLLLTLLDIPIQPMAPFSLS
jgi:hypothetical protein